MTTLRCVCRCAKGASSKSATISAAGTRPVPPCPTSHSAAFESPAVAKQTCSKSAKQSKGKLCTYQVPRRCQHKVKLGLSSCPAGRVRGSQRSVKGAAGNRKVQVRMSQSRQQKPSHRSGCDCDCDCYGDYTSSIFLDSRTRWDCISCSVYRTCCHFLEQSQC